MPDQETDPTRQRIRSALLKPSRSQVVVAVLLALGIQRLGGKDANESRLEGA